LHDNPIGTIDTLHNLSMCHSLLALTLYDTPLSLKRNYRHHVVNSIWSLKALDNYVISDEEIIEDAQFGDHFCTMHPNFAITLCPPLRPVGIHLQLENSTMLYYFLLVMLCLLHCFWSFSSHGYLVHLSKIG
jgi:hypothetical protein